MRRSGEIICKPGEGNLGRSERELKGSQGVRLVCEGQAERIPRSQKRDLGHPAHRVKAIAHAAVVLARGRRDGFAGQAVDAVVAPCDRAPVLLQRAAAVARGAKLVRVAANRRGHARDAIQRVVLERGPHAVGLTPRLNVVVSHP